MAQKKTLFQKIMDREEPADILYEDDRCMALRDINPQAPTHVLIVPRKPIPTLDGSHRGREPLVRHLVCAERDRPEWPVACHPQGVDLVGTLAH